MRDGVIKLQFDTDNLHDAMLRKGAEALGRKMVEMVEDGIRLCVEKNLREEVLQGIEFDLDYLRAKDFGKPAIKKSILDALIKKEAYFFAKEASLIWTLQHYDPAIPLEIKSKTLEEIEFYNKKLDEVKAEIAALRHPDSNK